MNDRTPPKHPMSDVHAFARTTYAVLLALFAPACAAADGTAELLDFSAMIENAGFDAAAASSATVRAGSASTSIAIGILAPGMTQGFVGQLTHVASGTYTLSVTADGTNALAELDEGNNVALATVICP